MSDYKASAFRQDNQPPSSSSESTPRTETQNSTSSTENGKSSFYVSSAPSLNVPKGGGALKSIDEKLEVNPVTGTCSLSVPLATSAGRGDLSSALSLSYDSGNGNGNFGIGWRLSLPAITRKTSNGIPKYDDWTDSDVFLINGLEDLVPKFTTAQLLDTSIGDYMVRQYWPRTEGSFIRIERFTNRKIPNDVYWRTISKTNITSVYGETSNSRIGDPSNERIFSWLICAAYDTRGNAIKYTYKEEDSVGVALNHACEQHRSDTSRATNRYIKNIQYGNRKPNRDNDWNAISPRAEDQWIFQIIFDYGDHPGETPSSVPESAWDSRPDPFSSYVAGFEVRTQRLCQRILMFHHLKEELGVDDYLVNSTELFYDSSPIAAHLLKIVQTGYARDKTQASTVYSMKSLSPLTFAYSEVDIGSATISNLDSESIENLPVGLGNSYKWIDLDGDGKPSILYTQPDGWFRKRNRSSYQALYNDDKILSGGNLVLGAAEMVLQIPNSQTSTKFTDIDGNGKLDLVLQSPSTCGFYERTDDDGWTEFRPFPSWPTVNLRDPNLRYLDLTGDGKPDIVISEADSFLWYPAIGTAGYGSGIRSYSGDEDGSTPRILFGNPTETIYLADFTGDGLTDVVRIRNGDICYWPNIGYGRFGKKIAMDNAPWLDDTESFSYRRILLGDIDGSGVADLLYFTDIGGIKVYTNLAGNSWAGPRDIDFPQIDSLANVQFLDLFGAGTFSLVWSTKLPGHEKSSLQYLDFTKGLKPHLLKNYSKGPLEVRMEYTPSSQYAQDDRDTNTPWPTKLPFPVQCLSSLTTYDYISRTCSIRTYKYHNGFYDGVEREFRGFGVIEAMEMEHYLVSDGKSFPDKTQLVGFATPTTRSVKFYSTGAYFESGQVTEAYKARFYGDSGLQKVCVSLKDPTITPQNMSGEEFRQAYRSLKGSLLRQEIYQDDASDEKSNIPITIEDHSYSTSMLQGCRGCHPGVFMVASRESLHFQLDRGNDARLSHHLNLDIDAFGNVTKAIDINYGRKGGQLTSSQPLDDLAIQRTSLITYQEQDFTNSLTTPNDYLAPLPAESRQYQVTGIAPATENGLFEFLDFGPNASTGRLELKSLPTKTYLQDDSTEGLRLVARKQTRYRSNDLTKTMSVGVVESLAIVSERYILAMSPDIFENSYQKDKSHLLLSDTSVLRSAGGDGAGYVELDHDNQFWIPSGQQRMSADANASPSAELVDARKSFFSPAIFLDPFSQSLNSVAEPQETPQVSHFQRVIYDPYFLRPIQITDGIGNIKHCEYDYAELQPSLITDENGNQEAFRYDELGALTYRAVMGKSSFPSGDSLDGVQLFRNHTEIETFLSDPVKVAKTFLGTATSYIFNDPPTSLKDNGFRAGLEVKLRRHTHVNDSKSMDGQLLIEIAYFDGLGRVIENKQLAEPDPDKKQWIAKNFTIYNKNNDPVRIFEPTYDDSPLFTQPTGPMVLTKFYDALHRLVARLMPDQTWTKTIYSPWATVSYDAGDTVLLDPWEEADVAPYFSHLGSPTVTGWYIRQSTSKDSLQQAAASLSKVYANTPTEMWLDVLGRSYLKISDNGNNQKYVSRTILDIQNNPRQIEDSKGRIVSIFEYDMIGNCLHSASMESGQKWTLEDVSGQQLYAWDSRNMRKRHSYDAARRETKLFIQSDRFPEYLAEQVDYGEGQQDDTAKNLRGKVYRASDQSGAVTTSVYDYKGNAQEIQRSFAKEYKTSVDLQNTVAMEEQMFSSTKTYNALSQIVSHTRPEGNTQTSTYNAQGQLHSVRSSGGILPDISFISEIQYDAKGDQTQVVYGNNTTCFMTYDPATFLLTGKKTLRGDTSLQSLQYTRDCMGNITHIDDASQQDLFFRGDIIHPSQDFTYDALGRLLTATGREHLGQSGSNWTSIPSASISGAAMISNPADAKAMGIYMETYTHDSEGNIMSVVHSLADKTIPGWTRSYTYREPSALEPGKFNNRLSATKVGSEAATYKYEGSGGLQGLMSSMSGFSLMQWDSYNQLQATSTQNVSNGQTPETTWYRYNSSGKRVRKVTERLAASDATPTRSKDHFYMDGYEIFAKFKGDGATIAYQKATVHIVAGEARVALVEADANVPTGQSNKKILIRYAINDQLSSVSIELDGTGQVISKEEFSPFGSTTFIATSQLRVPKRYRFSAKERDIETGLYYFEHRYLMVWLGRWLSPDTVGLSDGPNVFQYVGGDPINFLDPRGECSMPERVMYRMAFIEADYNRARSERETTMGNYDEYRAREQFVANEAWNAVRMTENSPVDRALIPSWDDFVTEVANFSQLTRELIGQPEFELVDALSAELTGIMSDIRNEARFVLEGEEIWEGDQEDAYNRWDARIHDFNRTARNLENAFRAAGDGPHSHLRMNGPRFDQGEERLRRLIIQVGEESATVNELLRGAALQPADF